MYTTTARSLQSFAPVQSFPFLGLPAELRQLVYTFIILEPQTEVFEELTPFYDFSIASRYYEQRRLCHAAAKSLRLTCRILNIETTTSFFKNKQVVINDLRLRQLTDLPHLHLWLSSSLPAALTAVRHLEFKVVAYDYIRNDADAWFIQRRSKRASEFSDQIAEDIAYHLEQIDGLLRRPILHLPQLEDITVTLSIKRQSSRSPESVSSIDRTTSSPLRPRIIMGPHSSESATTHGTRYDLIFFLRGEASQLYEWANDIEGDIWHTQDWTSTDTMFISHHKDPANYVLHEWQLKRKHEDNGGSEGRVEGSE